VIINLSGGGATAARPRFLPYAVSKCALVRATETLSQEYPELYFFAVAPGTLKTQMTESILKMGENIAGTEFASLQKKILAGGDGTEKAAELIQWLCCERPSHLNGKLISAIWDNYKDIDPKDVSPDQWTLRRVDAVLTNKLMNP
jgi:NAD(P)-dependent dehydrogenase (short-subunit alcohol dehydrogenase family)